MTYLTWLFVIYFIDGGSFWRTAFYDVAGIKMENM